MLVVLEGCDGVGKSTVARSLAKVLDARIVHCTINTPNDYKFFKEIIDASRDRNIIADRFCYGQFVYQTPGERKLSWSELTQLELDMLEAGAKVIHVKAPVEEVQNRLNLRQEKTSLPVEEIMNRFEALFEDSIEQPYIWWTGGNDCCISLNSFVELFHQSLKIYLP